MQRKSLAKIENPFKILKISIQKFAMKCVGKVKSQATPVRVWARSEHYKSVPLHAPQKPRLGAAYWGSLLVGLVPLESPMSPLLVSTLIFSRYSLFSCRFLPNVLDFFLKNTDFGDSGSGISELLVSRYWDFDFISLKNHDISNLSPGAVGVVHQGCTAQIWAPKSQK